MANQGELIKSHVKGFLSPVFLGNDEQGNKLFGLDHAQFERVRQGFACSGCLAYFDTYMVTCPACGKKRDVLQDIQDAPAIWQQHINERNQDVPTERYVPPTIEDAIAAVQADGDVDHVQLSKLRSR